jgi:hypothetical protein
MLVSSFPKKLAAAILCVPLLLAGCSNSDDPIAVATPLLVGKFLDAPVKGLEYETSPSGKTGVTNEKGEYEYEEGDTVIFRVQGISIGEVEASPEVPVTALPKYLSIARVLQTLDTEPGNDDLIDISKIVIPENIEEALETFLASDEEGDIAEILTVENLQEIETASIEADDSGEPVIDIAETVVTETEAVTHLSGTLLVSFTNTDIAKQAFNIIDDEGESATVYFLENGTGHAFDHSTSEIIASKDSFSWTIDEDGKLVIATSDDTITVTLHSITNNNYATSTVETSSPGEVYAVIFEKALPFSIATVGGKVVKSLASNSACSITTFEFAADGATGSVKSLCGETNEYSESPITLSEVADFDNVFQIDGTDIDGNFSVFATLVSGDFADIGSTPELALTSTLSSTPIRASIDKYEVVSEAVQEPIVMGGFSVEQISKQVFTRTNDNGNAAVIVVFNENNTGTEFESGEASTDSVSQEDFGWTIENGFLKIDYPTGDDVSVALDSISDNIYSVTVTEPDEVFNGTLYKVRTLTSADLSGKTLALTDASDSASCAQRTIKFTETNGTVTADMKEICGDNYFESSGFVVSENADFDNVITLTDPNSDGYAHIVLREGDLATSTSVELGLVFHKGAADPEAVMFDTYLLTDEELVEPITGPQFNISDFAGQAYVSIADQMVLAFENGRGTELNDVDGANEANRKEFSWSIDNGRLVNVYDDADEGTVIVELSAEASGNVYPVIAGDTLETLTDSLNLHKALPLSIASLEGKIIALNLPEDSSCSQMTFAFSTTSVNRVSICDDVDGGIETESYGLAESEKLDNVLILTHNSIADTETSLLLVEGSITEGQGKLVFIGSEEGTFQEIKINDMTLVDEEATLPPYEGVLADLIVGKTMYQHVNYNGQNGLNTIVFQADGNIIFTEMGQSSETSAYRIEIDTIYVTNSDTSEEEAHPMTEHTEAYVKFGDSDGNGTTTFYFTQADALAAPLDEETGPLEPQTEPNPTTGVTSLFSDSYQTNVVAGVQFSTDWDQASVSDVDLGGNSVKKYDMIVENDNPFVGIDFSSNAIDGTSYTHMRLDVWTTNINTLEVRLVDFNGTGWNNGIDNSEGVKVIDLSDTQGTWVRLNIPLTEFAGLAGTSELAQILLKATDHTGASTLYVDNLFFYDDPNAPPAQSFATSDIARQMYVSVEDDMVLEFNTDGRGTEYNDGDGDTGQPYANEFSWAIDNGRLVNTYDDTNEGSVTVELSAMSGNLYTVLAGESTASLSETVTFNKPLQISSLDGKIIALDVSDDSDCTARTLAFSSSGVNLVEICNGTLYNESYGLTQSVNFDNVYEITSNAADSNADEISMMLIEGGFDANGGMLAFVVKKDAALEAVEIVNMSLVDEEASLPEVEGVLTSLIVGKTMYQHANYNGQDGINTIVFQADGNLVFTEIGQSPETSAYRIEVDTIYVTNNDTSLEEPHPMIESTDAYVKFSDVDGTTTFYFNAADALAAPVDDATGPFESQTPPVESETNVKSLFSDSFQTSTVAVAEFSTTWDQAEVSDRMLNGNLVKKYEMSVAENNPFAGIDFSNDPVDGTGYTHMKLDVWTHDINTLEVRLVDFNGTGYNGGTDNSEGVKVVDLSPSMGSWVTLDIPFTDFVGLSGTGELAQIILKSTNHSGTSTLYVDNLYFFNDGSVTPTPTTPAPEVTQTPPTELEANVKSLFSDAYPTNTVAVTEFSTAWDQAAVSDVILGSDSVKKFDMIVDNGNPFVGIDFSSNAVDGTGYTNLKLDVWTADITTLEVRLVDFNGTGYNNNSDNSEGFKTIDLSGSQNGWVTLDIPFSELAGLAGTSELAQILLKAINHTGTSTLYVDNLYFYNDTSEPAPEGVLTSLIVGKTMYQHVNYNGQDGVSTIVFETNGNLVVTDLGQTAESTPYRVEGDTLYITDSDTSVEGPHPLLESTETYVTFSDEDGTTTLYFTEADALAAPVDYATGPFEAQAAPTESETNVKSLFSDSYLTSTVAVAEFSTTWDQAEVGDRMLNSNLVKKYEMSVAESNPFAGIDFSNDPVDGTGYTHLKLDVWTHDIITLEVRLVDFNGTGYNDAIDNSEGVKIVDLSGSQGSWVTLDIPFSELAGLAGTSELAQILLKATAYDGTSTLYVDNLYFYDAQGTTPVVTTAPEAANSLPTQAETDVKSLFGDAYQINTVAVAEFSTTWDEAEVADVVLAGGSVKKYEMSIANGNPFIGIDFSNDAVDGTAFNRMSLDVWTADINTLEVRLVDFNGTGWNNGVDNSEGVKIVDLSGSQNGWVTLDIPFSELSGLAGTSELAQILLKATAYNGTSTLYVDNLFFYDDGTSAPVTTPTGPEVAASLPVHLENEVVSLFSETFPTAASAEFSTSWDSANVSEVTIGGDATKRYSLSTATPESFAGIDFSAGAIDGTNYTHLHLDVWSDDISTLIVKLVDFNGTGYNNGADNSEGIQHVDLSSSPGTWVSLDIPFSDLAGLTGTTELSQIILVSPENGSTSTLYMDNLYFH